MTLYVKVNEKGQIKHEITIQEIKKLHAKTASITGAPGEIRIETEDSIKARRAVERENEQNYEKHIQDEIDDPFIPQILPAQKFHIYIRAFDEPPIADNRVVERGEVKFVDGVFKVIYTSRALTLDEQAARAAKKAQEDAAYKASRALTPLLTAETILLVHQLATAASIPIPPVIQKFKDEYGG